ncbi:MAG: hypothetical protein ACI93T_002053 [Porticoccaceae bacterium]
MRVLIGNVTHSDLVQRSVKVVEDCSIGFTLITRGVEEILHDQRFLSGELKCHDHVRTSE